MIGSVRSNKKKSAPKAPSPRQAMLVLRKGDELRHFSCLVVGENTFEYLIQAQQPLPIPGNKVLRKGEKGWVRKASVQLQTPAEATPTK